MSSTEEPTEAELIKQRSFGYAFKQQVMKAWQPVPNLNATIGLFLSVSIIFIIYGCVLLSYSNKVIETSPVQYNSVCREVDDETKFFKESTCEITVTVAETMEAPIFVYYQLDNFFQNHRTYVKSRSADQLSGLDMAVDDLSSCEPITTNKDTGRLLAADGKTVLEPSAVANPCGLVAKSVFNDTFTFDEEKYIIEINNIAWPSDRENKFKRLDGDDWSTKQWIDVEDEHFMVWMRTASLSTFRKLWGRVEIDLPKGDYKFIVENKFDVKAFDGKKSIVFSTANAFGGTNKMLAVSYLVVGCICLVVTIAFLVKKFKFGEKKKDN